MTSVLVVALGGALGSVLRYVAGISALRLAGVGFPYGTLFVNIVGSFVIGLLVASRLASTELRLFLITGLCGGFTTYSAFNEETLGAWRGGARALAAGYVVATLVSCIAAGLLGAALARSLR